jgi:hypothetical protein
MDEEFYWHQRSNLQWVLDGDLNTQKFHSLANNRKRKNNIFFMNIGNEYIHEQNKIK